MLLLFSCYVMSNSLWLHGLQHARFLCPPLSPGVCSNSCPLSQWCYLIISSSVALLSCWHQSFPSSGSFPTSWLFTSGGENVGASASVLPMTIQDWFPLGWTGWISLQPKALSRVFSNTTVQKHLFFSTQPSLWSKAAHGQQKISARPCSASTVTEPENNLYPLCKLTRSLIISQIPGACVNITNNRLR